MKGNLRETNLSWSTLRQTDLSDANLFQARLQWTNLSGATLRGAVLIDADLSQANTRAVIWTGAIGPDGQARQ